MLFRVCKRLDTNLEEAQDSSGLRKVELPSYQVVIFRGLAKPVSSIGVDGCGALMVEADCDLAFQSSSDGPVPMGTVLKWPKYGSLQYGSDFNTDPFTILAC